MPVGVTTETRGGRPVVVKRGDDADAVARLEHEAAVLKAADHPGVVALEGVEHDGPAVAVVTCLAGVRTLADDGLDLDDAQRAGVVAALAETVADLHDLGVVHGRIDRSHVVLASDGRPVLCGFAEARWVAQGADPVVDVQALGALLLDIADGTGDRALGRSVRALAERAAAVAPGGHPTARALASGLHQLLPAPADAPVPDQSDAIAVLRRGLRAAARPVAWWPPRRGWLIGGAAAVVAAVAGAVAVVGAGGSGGRATVAPPAPAASVAAPSAGATTPSTRAQPALVWPPPTTEPLVVEAGGARYEVGEPGDRVAVGDWDCDGTATAALLRPSSGDVFVFYSWASAGNDLTVEAARRVDGALGIDASDPDGDGCHDLVVETTTGTEVVR